MAIRFNASPNIARTSNVPSLTACTVVGWAKLSVDRNAYVTLVGLENSSTSETYLLQTDSDGTALKIWKDTGYSALVANLTVGTWFFFAFRFNGTNVAAFYGTPTDASLTKVEEARFTSPTPNRIIFGDDAFGDQFNGCIGELPKAKALGLPGQSSSLA
mgnify:CR=1 FL=1